MRKQLLMLATLALGALPMLPPAPAEAQTVIRACVVNSAGLVIRSHFEFIDSQGTRHASGWVTSALGGRNCMTLPDIRALWIGVEGNVMGAWAQICGRSTLQAQPNRDATLVVTGTVFDARCALQQ